MLVPGKQISEVIAGRDEDLGFLIKTLCLLVPLQSSSHPSRSLHSWNCLFPHRIWSKLRNKQEGGKNCHLLVRLRRECCFTDHPVLLSAAPHPSSSSQPRVLHGMSLLRSTPARGEDPGSQWTTSVFRARASRPPVARCYLPLWCFCRCLGVNLYFLLFKTDLPAIHLAFLKPRT